MCGQDGEASGLVPEVLHTRDRPLADDVDLDELVERTDGCVGADIEAVCREAATVAVREYVRATAGDDSASVDEIALTMDHFEQALEAVDSSAGSETPEFEEAPKTV